VQAGEVMAAASAMAALVPAAAAGVDPVREAAPAVSSVAVWVVSPASHQPTGTRPTRSQPYLHGNNI
jgi:hypothetical protein